MLATVRSLYRESRQETVWLRTACYAEFVTARKPAALQQDVPVFVFHSIDPIEFEAQLPFLADNGYRTLTADQFFGHLAGGRNAPPRSVLLTIDDGRASVWTFALPLLEKYDATAVVFLIPGFYTERVQPSETIADVRSGHCPAGRIQARDPELMSWVEIHAAAASGRVDFPGAHALSSQTAGQRPDVDYVNPSMCSAAFDLPSNPGRRRYCSIEASRASTGHRSMSTIR